MFSFFKSKIFSFFSYFSSKIGSFFSNSRQVDETFFSELEDVLISADVGLDKSKSLVDLLKQQSLPGASSNEIKTLLQSILIDQLKKVEQKKKETQITLMVGINGVGKTSFVGKYAKKLTDQGKKVLIVAADTFRAAAVDQLRVWADRARASFFDGAGKTDPAAVVFDGCQKFVHEQFDHIIIDTAGRLQAKEHLMKELEKIAKVVAKAAAGLELSTWIVIDSTLGQNSLEQARLFNEVSFLSGVVLTKVDSSSRGGIIFSICDALQVPVMYLSHGEGVDDITQFNAESYVKGIFNG
ncbi:signal recognition particle-docking protein FtsY [Candidatus Dependentiae bacterium]|nr:signal recognition particle-docking protein FtsY [Candidatus Dependentiae bacterium]